MTEKVLTDGATFLGTDEQFRTGRTGGLYHRDTRYLSELTLSLAGAPLTIVGSDLRTPWHRAVTYADVSSSVNEISDSEEQKHTTLALQREQVVAEDLGLVERLTLRNYSAADNDLSLSVDVDADFRDLFEVRGLETNIDRDIERSVAADRIEYAYDEPDAGRSTLTVGFDPAPDTLRADGAVYDATLAPQEEIDFTLAVLVEPETGPEEALYERALDRAGWTGVDRDVRASLDGSRDGALLARAWQDLQALVTETDHGPVALAGAPWFATVFGRDSLLTAYNLLHVTPAIAEGTLRFLAAHQGTEVDAYREERPGKILHEIRRGELARRGQIPHTPYYGTVDATPLWLIVLDETQRWTGDDALVADLWEHARAAAAWIARSIDEVGDDPFLYYTAAENTGLSHKAWRDTERSVQFADGRAAQAPLASVEVQGYVYDAFERMARLARDRDRPEDAREYERRAEAIAERFEAEFWLPERGYYAAAKTEAGEIVDSATSNVGHCLWSGIVEEGRAEAVVDTLLDEGLYSGWGVRTMSSEDSGYSPVSYHVGSVWPHDNALIAHGAADYGFEAAAETIATDVLAACRTFEHDRIPELYCGFDAVVGPHSYPSACEPQAWSASAPFLLLRTLFDIRPGETGYAAANGAQAALGIDREAAVSLSKGPLQ